MRIATFNLQNLRLRMRGGRPVLDGASDQDRSTLPRPTALDISDREETARVIAAADAEVVALQEVFDIAALDYFHETFLARAGVAPYPCRYCLPGNDGRGRNVAALCRERPLNVVSHAKLTGSDLGLSDLPPDLRERPLFRRDCLELDLGGVSLFVCHFKAPYPDREKARVVREAEARAVRRIVESRFARPESSRWIILGDFNEPAVGDATRPSALDHLKNGFSFDLLDRLPTGTDWTYALPGTHMHSRPDGILISPRLAEEYPQVVPLILRSGMREQLDHSAESPPDVPTNRPRASDHALVCADFPGLSLVR